MEEFRLVIQDPSVGAASTVSQVLCDAARRVDLKRLHVSVAYATKRGCDAFLGIEEVLRVSDCEKRWLVGIDRGVTEPAALERLRSLPNSEVRVSQGLQTLENGLAQVRGFHPKTYVFRGVEEQLAVFTGSANLTYSALHGNVEHGIESVWLPPLSKQERYNMERINKSLEWFDLAWGSADIVSDDFISGYKALREHEGGVEEVEVFKDFENEAEQELEVSDLARWSQARCFWIQTLELYKNRGEIDLVTRLIAVEVRESILDLAGPTYQGTRILATFWLRSVDRGL